MQILQIDRYPCAWPNDWGCTPSTARRNSGYRITLQQAYKELAKELKLLRVKEMIVSTNLPVRRDGTPYASVSEPDDPAVAVYWVDKHGKPFVVACDHWKRVRENMRAVGLAVAALRQLERTGATQVLAKAYSGFTALAAHNRVRTWREVLGVPATWKPTQIEFQKAWRTFVIDQHPDRGGDLEVWKQTVLAFDQARAELGLA